MRPSSRCTDFSPQILARATGRCFSLSWGIPASVLWYLIIKSHADLNRIKFKVIHEFEEYLPAVMYTHEWHLAEEGHGKTYWAVTTIERCIPILFAVLHVALAVMIVLAIAGVVDWTK